MKRFVLGVVVLLAGACSAITAPTPKGDDTCKSGYLVTAGDKCVPAK
jgi:hypothetical protein